MSLRESRLCGKMILCQFLKTEFQYIGHVIRESGVQVNVSKFTSIRDCKPSHNVTLVQSVIGSCNYCRRLIIISSTIAALLTYVTKNKDHFQYTKADQKSFEHLKNRLSRWPDLQYEYSSMPYELLLDMSEAVVGAVLTQTDETGSRPVASCCRKLNAAGRGYPRQKEVC